MVKKLSNYIFISEFGHHQLCRAPHEDLLRKLWFNTQGLSSGFQQVSSTRKRSGRILQSTSRKSLRQGESSEFGPLPSWNHAVGAVQKLATISR